MEKPKNKKKNLFPSTALFITFEGGEGSGKTTLIQGVKTFFEQRGIPLISTREPGGTVLGESIRTLLLDKEQKIVDEAELMLFLAARAQHLQEKIVPYLKRGYIVLCDRFNDSTIAYQGAGRGLGVAEVEKLCHFVCGQTLPDLTFYLDIPPEIGIQRAKDSQGGKSDRMESQELAFHQRVRECFCQLQKKEPKRLYIIDAEQSVEQVLNQALTWLKPLTPTLHP